MTAALMRRGKTRQRRAFKSSVHLNGRTSGRACRPPLRIHWSRGILR